MKVSRILSVIQWSWLSQNQKKNHDIILIKSSLSTHLHDEDEEEEKDDGLLFGSTATTAKDDEEEKDDSSGSARSQDFNHKVGI